jgi:hypothetical protein
MSAALSSARRRRAGPETVAPPPGVRQTTPQPNFPGQSNANLQQTMPTGLTLPQVIALVDKRLNKLESFMQTQDSSNLLSGGINSDDLKTAFEEYNARFDIIADEIGTMKDMLLKLQTYTMEVNKTLMDERIRILSDEPTPLEKALSAVDGGN